MNFCRKCNAGVVQTSYSYYLYNLFREIPRICVGLLSSGLLLASHDSTGVDCISKGMATFLAWHRLHCRNLYYVICCYVEFKQVCGNMLT